MDAAENNVTTRRVVGGELAELVTVPPQIRMLDHFILLIMVTQNQQLISQDISRRLDSSL